jgi:hypothetical protein
MSVKQWGGGECRSRFSVILRCVEFRSYEHAGENVYLYLYS